MKVNEFLQKYRRTEHGMNVTRPRVRCADGFTVSIKDTVYNYVPTTLVDKVLEAHGGITGADFSNDQA